MNSLSEFNNPKTTGTLQIDSLLDDPSPWNFLLPQRNILYYTFDAASDSYIFTNTSTTVTPFNETQKSAARQILNYAETIIGVDFQEVADDKNADIHFGNTNLSGNTSGLSQSSWRYSYDGRDTLLSLTAESAIFLDNVENFQSNSSPIAGTSGYETLLHEVGHTLGLGHPFNSPNTLPTDLDNTNNTVMSYTRAGLPKTTFQAFDLQALTWIYGGDGLSGKWGYNSTSGNSLNPTTGQSNVFQGTAQADIFTATANSETFYGYGGIDTVNFTGKRADYTLIKSTTTSGEWSITATTNGTDKLSNIERLLFSDKSIALDSDGNGGMAYRIYQAAFDRAPDSVGLGYWMSVIDQGAKLVDVAGGFINSDEFRNLYGSSPTNDFLVTKLYQNVLHRNPEQAGYDWWLNELNTGAQTVAQALANFSESAENKANLVGVIGNGFEYTPWLG